MQHRNNQDRWIVCRVYPGMFSDELVVQIAEQFFFVERSSVRNVQAGAGELQVQVVHVDGVDWAVLPTTMKDSVLLSKVA
jgi:hypothetical protein